LETVIAAGVLMVGLAVIGAQLQEAEKAVRKMNLRLRAMTLAEMQMAEMDLGLIQLDSVDAIQEEDFGPRYPQWAWRLTIDETAIESMYLLRIEVLYSARDEYEEEYDFDNAESVHTLYACRPAPQPLNLTTDFGLTEEQALEIGEKFAEYGINPEEFNPSFMLDPPFDEFENFIEFLPTLLQTFGMPLSEIERQLPPDMREALKAAGLLDALKEESESTGADGEGEGKAKGEGETAGGPAGRTDE
jgi:hypothetical protein